ncbi:MAG: hypothetical protein IKS61_03485 [Aeriscardovia sp.]|nr:hypothetical protein [Aeriscardovia sp.]
MENYGFPAKGTVERPDAIIQDAKSYDKNKSKYTKLPLAILEIKAITIDPVNDDSKYTWNRCVCIGGKKMTQLEAYKQYLPNGPQSTGRTQYVICTNGIYWEFYNKYDSTPYCYCLDKNDQKGVAQGGRAKISTKKFTALVLEIRKIYQAILSCV